MQHTVQHKRVERSALIVGIGANAVMGLAGVAVFLATGIEAIFLDAAITLIALVSGVVAIWISKRSVRTTERFPNGLFALEPVYAIGKAILTIALLAFSLISVSQSALDYVRYGIGEKMTLGPVVYYEIAMVAIGLGLFAYYRRENARIGGSSTLLVAESKATLVDAVISGGIGAVAVLLLFVPDGSPLAFLHYTGDFFITTLLVAVSAKEPIGVLRDSFVELVGGAVTDGPTTAHAADLAAAHLPNGTALDAVQVYKTGMSYNVEVYLACRDEFISAAELVGRKRSLERALAERFHIVDVDFVFD